MRKRLSFSIRGPCRVMSQNVAETRLSPLAGLILSEGRWHCAVLKPATLAPIPCPAARGGTIVEDHYPVATGDLRRRGSGLVG
jgi:hypothetical protein